MSRRVHAVRAAAAAGLLVLLSASVAGAVDRQFGIGAIVGDPAGISVKFRIDDVQAVDAAFGVTLSERNSFQFHADYLRHHEAPFSGGPGGVELYYGGGLRLRGGSEDEKGHQDDNGDIGLRVPLGVDWTAPAGRVDVFVEIVPILDLLPDVDFTVGGGIGVRYWF
jgi:hypothetical protein